MRQWKLSSRCRVHAGAIRKRSPRRYAVPCVPRWAPPGTKSLRATCTCWRFDDHQATSRPDGTAMACALLLLFASSATERGDDMIGRLNHVAIAVRDVRKAADVYRRAFGAQVS